MHLIAFPMTGSTCHHHGAWRHPESAVDDILGFYDLYNGSLDTVVGRG